MDSSDMNPTKKIRYDSVHSGQLGTVPGGFVPNVSNNYHAVQQGASSSNSMSMSTNDWLNTLMDEKLLSFEQQILAQWRAPVMLSRPDLDQAIRQLLDRLHNKGVHSVEDLLHYALVSQDGYNKIYNVAGFQPHDDVKIFLIAYVDVLSRDKSWLTDVFGHISPRDASVLYDFISVVPLM